MVTNKQIAHAFKCAKKHVKTGVADVDRNQRYCVRFICFALEHVERGCKISHVTCTAAKSVISERLEGSSSLEVWLKAKKKVSSRELDKDLYDYSVKAQTARHAWLDSLIKEFEAK